MWHSGLPLSEPFNPMFSFSCFIAVNQKPRVTYLLLSPVPYAHIITRTQEVQRSILAVKTTIMPHLRIGPYKGSFATVQIQMPFHAVRRYFRPSGGSLAPATIHLHQIMFLIHVITYPVLHGNTCA